MRFISVRDLRGKSAQVWKRLGMEKDMVVTSNGRPIAILSQVGEESLEESLTVIRRARAIQAVETMQQASRKAGLDRLSSKDINAEIQSVRKNRSR